MSTSAVECQIVECVLVSPVQVLGSQSHKARLGSGEDKQETPKQNGVPVRSRNLQQRVACLFTKMETPCLMFLCTRAVFNKA